MQPRAGRARLKGGPALPPDPPATGSSGPVSGEATLVPPGQPRTAADPDRACTLTVTLSEQEMEHIRRLAYYRQVDPSVIATEWVRREIRFLMSIRRDLPPGPLR